MQNRDTNLNQNESFEKLQNQFKVLNGVGNDSKVLLSKTKDNEFMRLDEFHFEDEFQLVNDEDSEDIDHETILPEHHNPKLQYLNLELSKSK